MEARLAINIPQRFTKNKSIMKLMVKTHYKYEKGTKIKHIKINFADKILIKYTRNSSKM